MMKKIHCLNVISKHGTDLLTDQYQLTEQLGEADGILVRSAAMHDMDLPDGLLAIARAGAGVNNIPLEKCAEKGIVVFNTPGANANGVKELVLASLVLASRDVIGGIQWCQSIKDDPNIAKTVEKGRRPSPAMRSRARSWESSAWGPSAFWWPTRRPPWGWRCTATIPSSPSTRPGCCPGT